MLDTGTGKPATVGAQRALAVLCLLIAAAADDEVPPVPCEAVLLNLILELHHVVA